MKEKVCLITGANRGIGKATALGLALKGATVIIHCRNRQLGENTREEIITGTGNTAIEVIVADLASLEAVRQVAGEVTRRHTALHVLVNNAGLTKRRHTLTEDSFETTLAVNHLAPFLLTNLLLDTLKSSAPARIVNVASMVHRWGKINFDDLMGQRNYSMDRAYNQSKLANILFTYELARRLQGSGVTVNCLEPGMVVSDFGREYTGFKGLMTNKLWRPFMHSPEKGADTVIYLASSPEVEGVTGKYFTKRRVVRSSRASNDAILASRLWEVSEGLTRLAS
ncbi:MAG: SDR family oxidoreductase [Fidelibacterota bacterium]|nr:MAG: SDR family oxidoreductase [Candidatus Neomarinimicrobiota bacterium]